jgi:hypothetical protein
MGLWKDSLDFYRSDPPTNYPADDWKLAVNWVYAWYESMHPSLSFSEPQFTCSAHDEASEASARTTEAAINGEMRRLKFKEPLRKVVTDGLLMGIGIWQLGYYGDGLVPNPGKSGDKPEGAEDHPPFEKGKSADAPYGYERDSIYTTYHRPDRFLIDPAATGLDDAMWCAVEFDRSLKLVKKDPQYRYTDDLEADEYDMPPGITQAEYNKEFGTDPKMTKIRLIQYWDYEEQQVYTFTKHGARFLQIRDWDIPCRRFPFYVFNATNDNFRFYNQAPVVPMLSMVNEYNLTISNRIDHISRNKSKILYNKEALSAQDVQNLSEARNLSIVGVDLASGDDVRKAVMPMQNASLPGETWQHTAEIRQRITEISGQSEFDAGGTRPGERPAAEIHRISAGADIRRFGLGSRLIAPLQLFGEDLRAVMQKYYSDERVVKTTDEFGDSQWVHYEGSNLRGEYSFTCNIEDLAPDTKEKRQQDAGLLLQLMTPYSQIASPIPRIDIDGILKKVSRELGVEDSIRFFPSVGPPDTPAHEWYLIVSKGHDLEPNEQDDHAFHLFTHQQQLEHPLTLKNPEARENLETHIERHEAMKLAQEQMLEAQQQQPGQAGSPGPAAGSPSNNEGGGAGAFSGNGISGGATSGGAGASNIQATLRQQAGG